MERNDLLPDVKKMIVKQLCKSKVLLMRYSEEEIARKIDENIKTLIIEKDLDGDQGYYISEDKVMAICNDNEQIEKLNVEEMSPLLFRTIIHESVHALLTKGADTGFAKKVDIEPVGPYELDFRYIGDGFNEGYTNWIVETTGIETNTYGFFTAINKQLAACIGEEKFIELSDGNYEKLFEYCNMSNQEGQAFLEQLDEIYKINRKMSDIEDIKLYIEDKLKNDKENDNSRGKTIENNKYWNQIFSEEVERELASISKNQEDGDVGKSIIYQKLIKKIEEEYFEPEESRKKMLIKMIESSVLEKVVKSKISKVQNLKDLDEILDILDTIDLDCRVDLDEELSSFEEYENIKKMILEKIRTINMDELKEMQQLYSAGRLTVQDLSKLNDEFMKKFIDLEDYKDYLKPAIARLSEYITQDVKDSNEEALLLRSIMDNYMCDNAEHLEIREIEDGRHVVMDDLGYIDAVIENDGSSSNAAYREASRDELLQFCERHNYWNVECRQNVYVFYRGTEEEPITDNYIIIEDEENLKFERIEISKEHPVKTRLMSDSKKELEEGTEKNNKEIEASKDTGTENQLYLPMPVNNSFFSRVKRKIFQLLRIGSLKEEDNEKEARRSIVSREKFLKSLQLSDKKSNEVDALKIENQRTLEKNASKGKVIENEEK